MLTAIAISPGNEHDGHHAGALVDQQPESRRPAARDRRHRLRQPRGPRATRATRDQGARPLAHHRPRRRRHARQGRVHDRPRPSTPSPARRARRRRSTSPAAAGPRPRRTRSRASPLSDCEPCPLRERCAPSGRRHIRINRREDLRQAALRELADPAQRAHLKRTRPRIERLLGLIVYRYHARTSRYNGARKTELQAVWTATLVNLHPIGTALRAQTALDHRPRTPAKASTTTTNPEPERRAARNTPRNDRLPDRQARAALQRNSRRRRLFQQSCRGAVLRPRRLEPRGSSTRRARRRLDWSAPRRSAARSAAERGVLRGRQPRRGAGLPARARGRRY